MKKSIHIKSLLCLAAAAALNSCDKPAPGMRAGFDASGSPLTGSETAEASAPTPVVAKTETPKAPPAVAATPKETPPKPVEPAPPAETPKPAAPAAGPVKRIQPEFPPPLFAGTPLPANNDIPNLDKSGKPITFADLPEGVQLLSKGAPVTSSDTNPFTGELKCITDGEKDGSDGFYVELAPAVQWVQIDLGAEKEIWAVWTWHFHKQAVIYKGVVAQISNDPEFKTATTIFNNDFDDSVKLGVGKDPSYVETNHGRFMPANGVKGRYVRLYSNGRYIDEMNHYIEVEVYGK